MKNPNIFKMEALANTYHIIVGVYQGLKIGISSIIYFFYFLPVTRCGDYTCGFVVLNMLSLCNLEVGLSNLAQFQLLGGKMLCYLGTQEMSPKIDVHLSS